MRDARTLDSGRDSYTASYTFWIFLVGGLLFAINELDKIFNFYLLLVPLILLPALAVGVWWVGSLAFCFRRGHWKRAASLAAAPVLSILAILLLKQFGVPLERVRFELLKPHYLAEIARIPADEGPRFKIFNWGGTGGAGVANVFYTLAFDESDEIAVPSTARSTDWLRKVSRLCPGTQMCSILQPNPPDHSVDVTKVSGHFYLVTEVYR
jgi:hypothetical protein